MQRPTISEASTVRSRPIMVPRMRISRTRPRQLGSHRLESPAEPLADGDAPLEEAVLLDGLDGRQGGAAGDRVAAEGGGVHPRLEHRGDGGLRHHHARGDAARQRLGARQDVGRDARVLVGEPLARAAHAGLDLVEDQEHAAAIAELAQAREVVGRRDVDPALALDRLDQDRGRLVVEHLGDRVEVVVGHVREARAPSARSRRGTWAGRSP